jgi:hypothetical protein
MRPTIDISAGLLSSTTAVDSLIKQWNICTTPGSSSNCPDHELYQALQNFFAANYRNYYQPPPAAAKCPSSPSYPLPPSLNAPGQ